MNDKTFRIGEYLFKTEENKKRDCSGCYFARQPYDGVKYFCPLKLDKCGYASSEYMCENRSIRFIRID